MIMKNTISTTQYITVNVQCIKEIEEIKYS